MSQSATKLTVPVVTALLLALMLFGVSPGWAKGNMKGNLDGDELDFIRHTFYPILIESNICTSEKKDCSDVHYIICFSSDFLSCDVYGITDEKVIKKIFLSMLNSGLKVSSFTFWRSQYHKGTIFEKPILSFTDHTGGK